MSGCDRDGDNSHCGKGIDTKSDNTRLQDSSEDNALLPSIDKNLTCVGDNDGSDSSSIHNGNINTCGCNCHDDSVDYSGCQKTECDESPDGVFLSQPPFSNGRVRLSGHHISETPNSCFGKDTLCSLVDYKCSVDDNSSSININNSSNILNSCHNTDDVFDLSYETSKLTPISKLISSQAVLSSSSSSTASSSSSSSFKPSLLWRRFCHKQSGPPLTSSAASSIRRQVKIPEEEERGDTSIVHRIFERVTVDLHSWDQRKVKNAKLMLRRLRQVGLQERPKAMSCPNPQSPTPTIKVTVYSSDLKGCSGVSKKEVSPTVLRRSGLCNFQSQRHHGSEPNLCNTDYYPPLFDITDSSILKRKDSVSRIRKKSSVQAYKRRLSCTSLGSQHISPFPLGTPSRRRSSLYGSTSPLQEVSSSVWKEEGNLVTWSNLLACIPPEERRSAQIRRHQVSIPIPVCMVGKEQSVMFTSLEVIEQTLRRFHPDVIVKKRVQQDVEDVNEEDDVCPDENLSQKENRLRRLSRVASTDNRKMSINTCITTMQSGPSDYDKQLNGIKSVGTFAEEDSMPEMTPEELKVLIAKRHAIACVIDAMKSFPEKEELQLNACESLHKMASASESNCVHILNNDGLQPMCNTLRIHSDNVEIVRRLLSTVAFISTAPELAKCLVTAGIHSEVLQLMSMHSSDTDIVRESCFIIGNLLISVDTAQQLMFVAGVHTIIGLVKNFPTDSSILENACRTLGSFAIYDETCLDVAGAGATSAVLTAVTSPAANASVLECGCWALATLTATAPTCQELVHLGGVKVILQVLTDYPREESLQDYGIRVLCNLSQQEETLSAVCTEQVFKLLHNAMVFFSESVELLEIIVVSLCQVISGFDELSTILSNTFFVCDLVTVMMEFSDNLLIQEHGCNVMGNLAVEDDLRKIAESQGASKAVISAMLTNSNHLDVQEVGCMAIMNLTADNKENKVRIKNAGVVPALLNTLDEFRHYANIVLCALKALSNLISLEEVCHLLLDEKGLQILISMMDLYEENEDILVFLAMVFCGITELPDLKEEETGQIDQVLTRIRSACQNNADIALFTCQAMENLIRTAQDSGKETFLQKNRIGATLSAMHCFTDNAEIHRTCCKLIAVVAYQMDSKKRLITETTVKSVLKSMELFPFDVDLQIIVCGTISCIIQKIGILKHEFIGHGGIALLKKAVDNHPKESRMAVMVLMVLGHTLPIDGSTYPGERKMAFDLIVTCMRNFSENKETQVAGCHALSKFEMLEVNECDILTKTVIQSLRRHWEDPEMQRKAAEALKSTNTQDKYDLKLPAMMQTTLASPKIVITEEFWKVWEN